MYMYTAIDVITAPEKINSTSKGTHILEPHSLTVARDQTTVQTCEESQGCTMIAWMYKLAFLYVPEKKFASFRTSKITLMLTWRL